MSAVSAQTDTITNPVSSLLTDTVLPQFIDLKQDISHLSFQELRLLRSYPYAIHGYHFMEADINAFFSANTKSMIYIGTQKKEKVSLQKAMKRST